MAKKSMFLHPQNSQFLGKYTLECIRSEKFLSCSQSSVLRLLSMDDLTVDSELQLVRAAIKWAKVQNCGAELDPQISKKLLGPCLEQLRILNLTPAEFSKYVANSGLFSSEDTLKILIYLTAPNCAMEVPQGINTNTNPRKALITAAEAASVAEMENHGETAELKLIGQSVSVDNRGPQVKIKCIRRSCTDTETPDTQLIVPCKFEVDEFKVNKDMFLTGIRVVSKARRKNRAQNYPDLYKETIHVTVRPVHDKKSLVAFRAHIAYENYEAGFYDVIFPKPGALMAGILYVLDVEIISHGIYSFKTKSNLVRFQDYEFTFSGDSNRFPYSGILKGLLLEL